MACQPVTGGYKCDKGNVTFNAGYDPSNPVTIHAWNIDGQGESTLSQFTKNFSAAGLHTVQHSGFNACGGLCSQTQQLEIVDTLPPPPAGASSAPASSSSTVLIVGGLLAAVVIAAVAMSGKK